MEIGGWTLDKRVSLTYGALMYVCVLVSGRNSFKVLWNH